MNDFKLTISTLGQLITNLTKFLTEPNKTYRVSIKEWRDKRSLSQNALFHVWVGELSKYLISKGRPSATPEWCKELLKHTFLGYTDIERTNAVTGEKTVVSELKHTSSLDTGEMTYFMNQVYSWCVDKGLFLPIPEDCEYNKLTDRQND